MKSLTYYLTLAVIKLKGIKNDFGQSPINYLNLRKQDVLAPPAALSRKHAVRQFKLLTTGITELQPANPSGQLLLFCHGGAFVSGPAQHHWDTAARLVEATGCTLWMVAYPKAPEHKIDAISHNLDVVYAKALVAFGAENLTLIGDSAGGTLLASLTQRLVQQSTPLPGQLILISPVMDASCTNPAMAALDKTDPMLAMAGVRSAKELCALDGDLKDPRISPLYGSFAGFPPTVLFLAENDITYPDQKIAAHRLHASGVQVTVITGKGMPHIWPLLPVMHEAKAALKLLIAAINNRKHARVLHFS